MSAFDIAIIGGGVIGTSCAFHLVEKGFDVVLIEQGDIASGTSSHCDAEAMLTDKQPGPDAALGYASIMRFKELAAQFSYDFEFAQHGSLYVCETDQEMEIASEYIRQLQSEGYPVRMVDTKEMADIEPFLARDLKGGFWSDVCSSMSPYKLCYAFIEESKPKGLTVYTHCKVQGIKRNEKGAVQAVVTEKGTIACNKVINCCGCWAPEIGKMVGLDIPIIPRKGVILLSERGYPIVHQKVQEYGYMLTKFQDKSVVRDIDEDVKKYNVAFTLEATAGDNFMLGSSRNFVGFDIQTEIEVVHAIAKRGIRFFPILKEINCIRAYAGLRPYVEDHLPIISDVEEVPGFYIAAGHEGDGISMAPITGKLIAQMMAGEKTDLDMNAFRFSRFKA